MVIRLFAVTLLLCCALSAAPERPHLRTFEFTYSVELHDLPSGAKHVDLWVPYPQSDAHQKILAQKVTSLYPTTIGKDRYGNAVLHLAVENPATFVTNSSAVSMTFTVQRSENVHNQFKEASEVRLARPADLDIWLQPDRLVPLDKRIRELSAQVTAGKSGDMEKARAIYEYVFSNMRYDKSGTGWGNGDIYWACDAKRGNCTDFHSLFIGLARAAGIPAKFEIGFSVPEDKPAGEIDGYHCWAEFYLSNYGWVPVDISEAWKNPAKREYYFGAHDANRVQFSLGRDLTLVPRQSGPPLNFFVYPYAEVDGRPFTGMSRKFSYRDLATTESASQD